MANQYWVPTEKIFGPPRMEDVGGVAANTENYPLDMPYDCQAHCICRLCLVLGTGPARYERLLQMQLTCLTASMQSWKWFEMTSFTLNCHALCFTVVLHQCYHWFVLLCLSFHPNSSSCSVLMTDLNFSLVSASHLMTDLTEKWRIFPEAHFWGFEILGYLSNQLLPVS